MTGKEFGAQAVNIQVTDPSQQYIIDQEGHIAQHQHAGHYQPRPVGGIGLPIRRNQDKEQQGDDDRQRGVKQNQLDRKSVV